MIGNDVVDLNLAKTQSNWRRKRFIDKIFTKREQLFIKNAMDSSTAVWLLWSMKESAYKIYSRQNKIRFFSPKKFECEMCNSQNTVNINNTIYFTTSTISNDSIHTIATVNINKMATSDSFILKNETYKVQHQTTYQFLKAAISNQFNIPISKVIIKKDSNGIPQVSQAQNISLSISHHGVYGAYAFAK